AHGIGVVPWKVAWAGDSSYKTHQKSKAEQEEKLRAMQEEMTRKVASLESHMDARVNKAVQLALSQRGTAGSHPDVVKPGLSATQQLCIHSSARRTSGTATPD